MNDKKKTQSEKWPTNGLESVKSCPVCGEEGRQLLHKALTDRVFFCAPGEWSMYRCEACASAYLDPRPTPETISLAYQQYFTHAAPPAFSSFGFLMRLRRKLANGYRNHRYGTQDYPASKFGIIAAKLMPNGKATIDAGMRHLSKVKSGERLLDVGCGNGAFLVRAKSAGWDVVGIDLDFAAVELACSKGLDVRLGGVETLNPSIEQFDVITLSHVIEHVFHPIEVLSNCYNLLKPGGCLWIDTPNINSEGYRRFGSDWVHLDPPRHLLLFTSESLCSILREVEFENIEIQPNRLLCASNFSASISISEGVAPFSGRERDAPSNIIKEAERIGRCNPSKREYITVKAWKK